MSETPLTDRRTIRNFIVFEGIDGTGTTTQIRELVGTLRRRGMRVWATAEPTSSPIGMLIRGMLRGETPARPETIAYLFAADRHEHLFGQGGIVERSGGGEIVVCDRYLFSSLAYQGSTCGKDLPERLNRDFPLPSLVFHFRVDPETSLERVKSRGSIEIFEHIEFQHRVSEAYEGVFGDFAGSGMKIVGVDAGKPIAETAAFIAAETERFFGANAV
ncbi:MAG: dTMP kinase [Spirochaetes bacterium]|nr:dTMP kinase [Spirochaetota bacterium]